VSELTVRHFGPDPATTGGMATVIRLFVEHRLGADTVKCHPTWRPQSPLTSAALTTAAARAIAGMPSEQVAHVHVSERGSFLREGSLIALARRRRLRTVATIHGASFIPFAHRHPRLAASTLARADVVTCLDEETLAYVQRNAPGARAALVPNPIAVDGGGSCADTTEELVVFAGEIGLRKGADVMARAWPLIADRRPRARCLMVGPEGDFTPPRVERLEVSAPVDADEMKEIMRRARVIALPSRAERAPMALIEAMSLGRPFVSTPVGGIPELAAAGGKLVSVGNERALADGITDLLADPALARMIGERGRRFCRQTRSVEVVGALFRELYSDAGA
jgi:glycosyltransferase involved in cell wall biosynthesis